MFLRRKIFGVLTAGAVALSAGCTTTQVTNFLAQVQTATAQACMFVPTIDTILGIAASLGFAPATAAAGAITAVSAVICQKVPPPASAKFQALAPVNAGPAHTVGTATDANGSPMIDANGKPITIKGWRTH